jgi:hypothetical protein
MAYDWSGVRQRRMKVARLGAALTLAATIVTVAFQVVGRALYDVGVFGKGTMRPIGSARRPPQTCSPTRLHAHERLEH